MLRDNFSLGAVALTLLLVLAYGAVATFAQDDFKCPNVTKA